MEKLYATYSDEQLVALLSKAGREAERSFTVLYNRYASRIHAYCFRIIEDSTYAEDMFQETFIRFYQTAQSGRTISNVAGFMITIARNLCLNYKRDKKDALVLSDIDFYTDTSQNYEQKELLDLIARSLELLSFEYREIFILREYDGLSYEEIAEVTGTTVTNAKTRAFRAKQKVKEILQPYLKDLCE
jgi:RNA polymerase sigma-70 factor (ECF subfamily)